MNPLIPALVPDSEYDAIMDELLSKWKAGNPEIRSVFPAQDSVAAAVAITAWIHNEKAGERVYMNDVYQVHVRLPRPGMVHLSIKRIDREPVHDWRDLQEIKNQICGSECEAVELYPAESRVVDTANQYHLWVCTDEKFRFPFGFSGNRVVTDEAFAKSINRQLKGRAV